MGELIQEADIADDTLIKGEPWSELRKRIERGYLDVDEYRETLDAAEVETYNELVRVQNELKWTSSFEEL